MTPPVLIEPRLDQIPEVLRKRPHWVVWKLESVKGRPTKVPYGPVTGRHAESDRPATWGTFQQAVDCFRKGGYSGVGLMNDGTLTFVDYDGCVAPDGTIEPWAVPYVDALRGRAWLETSPGGRGIHGITIGSIPPGRREWKLADHKGVAFYPAGRYLALTGQTLPGSVDELTDQTEALTALWRRVFPAEPSKNGHHKPAASSSLQLDDSALIERALAADDAGKFRRLWNGEWQSDYASQSEADMALTMKLAFWTGRDPSRIDVMFRQSGLMRDKWERQDYRERTLQQAVERTSEVWGERRTFVGQSAPPANGRDTPNETTPGATDHDDQKQTGNAQESQATKLLKLVTDIEFFRSPEGVPYGSFFVNGHIETHPLRSGGFRTFLARRYYEEKKHALSSKALQDAIGVLEGKALYEGEQIPVYCRVGQAGDTIYIDLGDDGWNAIEACSEGWRIVERPPVKFRRCRGMMPLPMPTRSTNGRELLGRFINVSNEDDLLLVSEWVLACMRPAGPFPILIINSDSGSGKTSACTILRRLVDPNEAPLRALPKEERDLMICAVNSWILGLDNISHIPDWLSDAICRLSTGAGFATRQLHTDQDEIILFAKRPTIINGIEHLVSRGDLMDRSIVITLPPISEKKRIPELKFWADFNAAAPAIHGYLLDALCGALGNLASTKLPRSPRMADFALWATAAEVPLGWQEGSFLPIYESNRAEGNQISLAASPIAGHICDIVTQKKDNGMSPWEGTATDLLNELDRRANTREKSMKSWPQSPRGLTNALRRLRPNLRAEEIYVGFIRDKASTKRERLIILSWNAADAVDERDGKTDVPPSESVVVR